MDPKPINNKILESGIYDLNAYLTIPKDLTNMPKNLQFKKKLFCKGYREKPEEPRILCGSPLNTNYVRPILHAPIAPPSLICEEELEDEENKLLSSGEYDLFYFALKDQLRKKGYRIKPESPRTLSPSPLGTNISPSNEALEDPDFRAQDLNQDDFIEKRPKLTL